MTEKEKMLAGMLYDPTDPELVALREKAHALCKRYNDTVETQEEEREALMRAAGPRGPRRLTLAELDEEELDEEARIAEVTEKASVVCHTRLIRKLRRRGAPGKVGRAAIDRCLERIDELTRRYETLTF